MSLDDEEGVKRIVIDRCSGSGQGLRPSKRNRYRVAVFGSARCVDNAEQAIAVVREHHVRWLSDQGTEGER